MFEQGFTWSVPLHVCVYNNVSDTHGVYKN